MRFHSPTAGLLAGTGELRMDLENRQVVHLGLAVGGERRREGIGTSLFAFLVAEALRRGLLPVCSTGPG
ncbi:MAG: GNAT family N-acetyltransferase [Planctomycetota bacterium]